MKAVDLKLISLFVLIFVAFSCKKADVNTEDQLIAKWMLTDKTVDNNPVLLNDCEKRSSLEFQASNFCLLYDACADATTNSGWNYKYEMLNISELLPAAFYIEQVDNSVLKLRRKDISPEGKLQVTVLSYVKIP
jgi:hypothetical protein